MSEELGTVEVEFDDESGIGYLTMDRPGSLNALDVQLRSEIVEGLSRLYKFDTGPNSEGLRIVILTGAEGNFSVGADLNEMDDNTNQEVFSQTHYEIFAKFPVPILAKIRGYCLGGGLETAMACDFRFAHNECEIGLPEIDLGIMPGGGVQFLSFMANPSVAKELAMSGEPISGKEAQEIGIVNKSFTKNLDEKSESFARKIAAKNPEAIRRIKLSANMAVPLGLWDRWQIERRNAWSLVDLKENYDIDNNA